jgi:hypothetical protein
VLDLAEGFELLNKLVFGVTTGGGEFTLVGAFVRLVPVPVPVLY